MSQYKVSVVVPVYNSDRYLLDCLKSLISQTIFNEIEVVIADDGSSDNSGKIYNSMCERYNNIHSYYQSHQGVSYARNMGIEKATGKYVMFLDSDDQLESDTIEHVYNYFEEVYDQVDVVTYPEKRFENGVRRPDHCRYQILKETGVYDLTQFIYITQSRLNVAIKNDVNKIYFDTKLQTAEDQEFLFRIIKNKMKIGFVKNGAYIYNLHSDSISFSRAFVYYNADNVNYYYKKMFSSFGDKVPAYFQAMFLYDINWKVLKDQLWPYHYEDEDLKEFKADIIHFLSLCDVDVIMRHPSIDLYHKFFLLKLKNADVSVLPDENSLKIICENKIINENRQIQIIICQFNSYNGKIKIIGHMKNPSFSFTEKPRLFMLINEEEYEEISIFESTASRYKSKMKTNMFLGFYVEKDLSDISKIVFKAEINGVIYNTDFYFMPYTALAPRNGINFLVSDDYMISLVNNNEIIVDGIDTEGKISVFNKQCKRLMTENPELFEFFQYFDIYKRKEIWLYYDCRGVKKDNGYWQFIHDFEKKDGVKRYYIYNNEEIDITLFEKKHYKYLVKFGSDSHKLLFINCNKILGAFIERNNIYPFNANDMNYINNWLQIEYIYLQHGILHAHVPWKYTPESLRIDKVVVSSDFETFNFHKNYNFRINDIIKTGMARFDSYDKKKRPKKKILFAPSWRNYLIKPQVDNYWEPMNEIFENSDYYKKIIGLLMNNKLDMFLKDNDYFLDFKLHPIFQNAYKDYFCIKSDRINVIDEIDEIEKYSIFITDFSSFCFDFVFLKRAILYFVPDYEQFLSGMNQYRMLDLDFKDAFGPLTTSAEDLIKELINIVEKNDDRNVYKKRMSDFFYKGKNKREQLYKVLRDNK